ncbi:MAG TPA: glycoside hydrolase family 38 C-terminal domain-containing protein [Clostridia bacterium]|nr:glycoside hydrolase family 38 C-terminal domain-containing protein [Clostridia bacterium]
MRKNKKLKPAIYTIATAHLDTSWSWDFEKTLSDYLPKTLTQNFEMLEKYPQYVFSFEGSYRYELMEEYYPELFEKLKEYIEAGRWNVAGSAYENGDVNIPAPEALFRNFLYGNDYFYKKFGKRSVDVFLPDCFGFGYALPSVAAHSNLKGFITQKLVWSSAYGVPFDIGVWSGPDGQRIYAALDARDYNATLRKVRIHPGLRLSLRANTKRYSLPMTVILHGVGDRGGAPREESIKSAIRQAGKNQKSKIDVIVSQTDQVFRDIEKLSKQNNLKLPVWDNELVMTDHAIGGYTSRAISKRWNRRGEQLALTAERMAVFADLNNLQEYPQQPLKTAWKRIVAHQFHDDITGTSLEECYKRNWNDYMLSINTLAEEYRSAVGSLSCCLDTYFAKGTAVVVCNPLQCVEGRRETVSAEIEVRGDTRAVRVFDGNGEEVPSQILEKEGKKLKVAFCADVPSVGIRCYDIQMSEKACELKTDLSVTQNSLENEKYKVRIDANGDISSIYDKIICKELLSAPIRMALSKCDGNTRWPAWELVYKEIMDTPVDYAQKPIVRILEKGPARVSLEIIKNSRGSEFKQIISLDSRGEFVKVFNEIEWRSLRTLLKTEFVLNADNEKATYDLGLGVIERGNNKKTLYEVPAQMWADITDTSGLYGVSVLSDSKYGWDKPRNNTIRLTGVYSPRAPFRDNQHLQEFGLNRYSFAIYSHGGSWQNGTQQRGMEFNEPMGVFEVEKHKSNGCESSVSYCSVSDNDVLIRAIKKAENSNEIIVRLNEGTGRECENVELRLNGEITQAREVYASEENIDEIKSQVIDGKLIFNMAPYEVRSFALKVKPEHSLECAECYDISLTFNADAVSTNGNKADGSLPKVGSIPAEQFPKKIVCGGVSFKTGPIEDGEYNAMTCKGQKIDVPEGCGRTHIIAASFDEDKACEFKIGQTIQSVKIQSATQRIAAWDLYSLGETGYVKTDTLAWNTTHMHSEKGDDFGRQVYFYKYSFVVPKGQTSFEFPDDESIVVLSATGVKNEHFARTLSELYDTLEPRECTYKISQEEDFEARNIGHHNNRFKAKFIWEYVKRRLKKELSQLF